MRIFISILRFEPARTLGSEVYLRSLLRALSKIVIEDKIIIAASEKGVEWGKLIAPDFEWIPQAIPDSTVKKILTESKKIEKLAKSHNADVIFFPFNLMPKSSVPSVLLIHDLVNEFYSRNFPLYRPLYFQAVKMFVRKSIKRADNLITISHFIADELKKLKFVNAEQKVFVVPLASQRIFDKIKQPTNIKQDNRNIILQTGDHLPHKSHITGLKAMSLLSRNYPDLFNKLHLVLTGGYIQDKTLKKFVEKNNLENNITFLGKVSNEGLEWLMKNSSLIAFPTIYEGFGLGIIEAQLRGKPIILSDIPVLREVSGNQAVFFKPQNPIDMADKIKNFFNNKSDYQTMIDSGKQNAVKWSWENHAREVLNVLRETAKLSN